jgi:6-pyruvoyltetrahydropterin/6-carboxytetrahydropterin synthase
MKYVLSESLQYMQDKKVGVQMVTNMKKNDGIGAIVSATKRFEFDAAHRLPNHQGLCRNIHGHRYALEVTVRGDLATVSGASDEGMVVDFHDLKKIVAEEIVAPWDHALLLYKEDPILRDSKVFEGQKLVLMSGVPTAENMAVEIHQKLSNAFRVFDNNRPIALEKIRLYETPTSWVDVCN